MATQSLNKRRTIWIIIGTMVGILLASLDSNIVSTAMPKIIGSLNGTALYTWPVTVYMLCMTISIPIVGKLSDVYGYKPIYLLGIIVFLVGSIFCGFSQSMMQFIAFRGLQGIGGAVLISNTVAIIGILFPPADRAKYGSFVSAASGIASLIGPVMGGLITDNLNWRWVFFVNIPLGAIALFIVVFAFPASHATAGSKKIDYAGAAVMIIALVPMLLALSWGGEKYSWNSIQIIGMIAFAVIMLVIFGLIEQKASDPIISMSLFKNSIFDFSAIEMFLFNGVLMTCIIFVPLFLQNVKGLTASGSGAIITPMLVSLVIGVMISGLIISKTCRYKLLSIVGFLVMGAGAVVLMMLNINSSNVIIVISMIVMGLGIGVSMAIFNVTAQNVFPNSQLGAVTSSIQFSGRIGQTIASSVLGTVFGNALNNGVRTLDVSKFPSGIAQKLKNSNTITDSASMSALKPLVPAKLLSNFDILLSRIKQVLSNSIHLVFIICAVITLASLIIVLFMKEVPMSKKPSTEEPEQVSDDAEATE
ncbi:MAG: MDR family MFS transporter [Ethanoligenens sp.]